MPAWCCNSGIAYGGNKTRKLEYLVAEVVAGFAALGDDRPRRVLGIDGSAKPAET